MSAQHTPGPFDILADERGITIKAGAQLIARMAAHNDLDNAQLFAAAPDLLAAAEAWDAAEDARNDCPECDNEGPWEHCEPCSDRFGDAIDLRHAAIAKARGQ